jgi:uncharacterized protein (TIGR01777 family)
MRVIMRALITGATGFIGRRLAARLERPAVLGRDPEKARAVLGAEIEAHRWEPEAGPPPPEAFRGIDVVFHLAGESVGEGRWNAEKKRRIRESRVAGTRNLVAAIGALPEAARPKALVSASAIGVYGERGDDLLDEGAAAGEDFLAEVCRAWEAEAARARDHGVRVVTPRIGLVLGREGGALPRMLLPFRLGLGGRLGSGRQWVSWIHVDDLVSLLVFAAARAEVAGPLNAVAPNPVTNREFTKALGTVLRRPTLFPVPRLMLRLAVGEFASVLLMSQRVIPREAEKAGFTWKYPSLRGALEEILLCR